MPPAERARTAKRDGQERPIARLLVRPGPMEEATNGDAPSGQDGCKEHDGIEPSWWAKDRQWSSRKDEPSRGHRAADVAKARRQGGR